MAGEATIDPMTTAQTPAELPPSLTVRRGRIVFRARRPVALVLPLLAVTEIAGVICLLIGATIGWFVIAAPVIALGTTAVVLRPALELTRDGLAQRQYPYSSLTCWDVIDSVGITRAGNRVILAYKLLPGIPPPRHQPVAAMLRAVDPPYDGRLVRRLARGRTGRGARSGEQVPRGPGAPGDAPDHTALRPQRTPVSLAAGRSARLAGDPG